MTRITEKAHADRGVEGGLGSEKDGSFYILE